MVPFVPGGARSATNAQCRLEEPREGPDIDQPPSGCWERADSSRGQLVLEPSEPRFITMAGSFWGPRLCPAALTSSLLVCQGAQQPGSITGCWCRAG